jgi:hypothetical protein
MGGTAWARRCVDKDGLARGGRIQRHYLEGNLIDLAPFLILIRERGPSRDWERARHLAA